jgi:protein AaeX
MPRDIALFDAYVPILLLLAIAGAAVTWVIDRLLAYFGMYRFFWHPSLVRVSLLTCVIGLLGLAAYR